MDKEILKTISVVLQIIVVILGMTYIANFVIPAKKPIYVNQISHFKCEAYHTKLICTLEKVTDERSDPNETGSTVR